jgi:hypothetical protein
MSTVKEGVHVTRARNFVALSKMAETTATQVANAKQEVAQLMHKAQMRSFEVRDISGKKVYNVRLERPTVERVSPRKLYTMLANGEIDLEDFLSVITVNKNKVSDLIGDKTTASLIETYQRGLDLIVEEV